MDRKKPIVPWVSLNLETGAKQYHQQDEDCAPFLVNGSCTECGVDHYGECATCKGRGFHRPDCPESDGGRHG